MLKGKIKKHFLNLGLLLCSVIFSISLFIVIGNIHLIDGQTLPTEVFISGIVFLIISIACFVIYIVFRNKLNTYFFNEIKTSKILLLIIPVLISLFIFLMMFSYPFIQFGVYRISSDAIICHLQILIAILTAYFLGVNLYLFSKENIPSEEENQTKFNLIYVLTNTFVLLLVSFLLVNAFFNFPFAPETEHCVPYNYFSTDIFVIIFLLIVFTNTWYIFKSKKLNLVLKIILTLALAWVATAYVWRLFFNVYVTKISFLYGVDVTITANNILIQMGLVYLSVLGYFILLIGTYIGLHITTKKNK